MKKNILFTVCLAIFTIYNGSTQQLYNMVKSKISEHLSAQVSEFVAGSVSISDVTENGKTIVVQGTFKHNGFWTTVTKPFVAHLTPVLDELKVKKVAYWKYLSAFDKWQLICTDGSNNIEPLPSYPSRY